MTTEGITVIIEPPPHAIAIVWEKSGLTADGLSCMMWQRLCTPPADTTDLPRSLLTWAEITIRPFPHFHSPSLCEHKKEQRRHPE